MIITSILTERQCLSGKKEAVQTEGWDRSWLLGAVSSEWVSLCLSRPAKSPHDHGTFSSLLVAQGLLIWGHPRVVVYSSHQK